MDYHPLASERDFHHRVLENLEWTASTPSDVDKLFRPAEMDDEVPKIPDPSLFQIVRSTKNQNEGFRLPNVAECAAHLELLATLSNLKGKVLASAPINGTMGFASETRPSQAKVDEWQNQKWTKFVEFAVVRFLAWRSCMDEKFKAGKMSRDVFDADEADEIPIDVLMVWSVFMLSPKLYEKHCSTELIYDLGLPWEVIHESIDSTEEWTWEPLTKQYGVIGALGLGSDLFNMFETWKLPNERQRGAPYPGLNEFEFLQRDVINENCLDEEHKNLIDRYVNAFSNIDFNLAGDLKEAVLRQELFWRKMTDHMWIRSPAVEGTLRRAIDRYDLFVEIRKRNSKTTVVPTLDIDLVWHTHQCSGGRAYATQTARKTGNLLNHDDKLGQEPLATGYDSTRELYRARFGTEYRICGCWECELLISEMENVVDVESRQVDMQRIITKLKEKMLFYRAVETMRRHGRRLPAVRK